MKRWIPVALLFLLSAGWFRLALGDNPAAKPKIEPKADEILKKASRLPRRLQAVRREGRGDVRRDERLRAKNPVEQPAQGARPPAQRSVRPFRRGHHQPPVLLRWQSHHAVRPGGQGLRDQRGAGDSRRHVRLFARETRLQHPDGRPAIQRSLQGANRACGGRRVRRPASRR